ncbi:hypothetical protein BDR26DRAFT_806160 [Obelidium mucronatum]|nr:hypothetical protein BDR26DRAFT_806160 [Obelidium mucronatum]
MSLIFRRLFSATSFHLEKKNLFVGNLSWTTKGEDLATLFSQFGKVESARVMSDRETGRSRGFGFVEMAEATEADAAIEKLNGLEYQGRELKVCVCLFVVSYRFLVSSSRYAVFFLLLGGRIV